MANKKNDCKTCPILEHGPCPLFNYAYIKKGLEGIEKCEMRARIEVMAEAIKEKMVTWAGRKAKARENKTA